MLNNILKNNLVKQTSILASGTIIAQIIGLIATPILSRFYTPDDFGLFGSILTIAAILSTVSSLKYEMAIVLTSNKTETRGLLALSIWLLLMTSGLVSIVILIYPELLTFIDLEKVSVITVASLLLLVFGYGLFNIFYQLHSKFENYTLLSKSIIVQKLGIVILQLLIFVFFANTYGLIIGFTIGWLLALIILIIPELKELKLHTFRLIYLKLLAKKYYRFSCFTAPQSLFNAISQGLPILMIGYYFDATAVGLYFFTVRVLQLPTTIISKSIRQVFYKQASDLISDLSKLKKEYLKITTFLFKIILIPVITIFMFGPEIFQFLFGSKWLDAGEIASWLFLWIGLLFINQPTNALLLVLKKNKIQFILDFFLIIFRLYVLYYGGSTGDLLFTIKLFTLVGVAFNLLLIFLGIYYTTYGYYSRR